MEWHDLYTPVAILFSGTAAWMTYLHLRKTQPLPEETVPRETWGFDEMYEAFDHDETKASLIEEIKAKNFDNVDFTTISTDRGLDRVEILSGGRPVGSLEPKYLNALREMEVNNELPGRLNDNTR